LSSFESDDFITYKGNLNELSTQQIQPSGEMLSTSGTSHQAAPNSGKHCIANFAPKPYNATINVPLKISYALTPIPKSSQYHPNTMPNPILKDISHQHMEGVQFLVLDEPLQSSTSTSISG